MAEITLRARPGREPGSRQSRRIRSTGEVPAIVYGRGLEPVPVTVNHHDITAALRTEAGGNVLINLEIEGAEPVLTMARQVDRHPFRNQIRHVDFVKVSLTEKVSAEVTLRLVGDAAGVREGGILGHQKTTVAVEALPTEIPPHIDVDVSALEIGDVLRVEDLTAIPGVEYLDDPEAVVASVSAPIVEVEEEELVEVGEEGELGEEEAEEAPEDEAEPSE